MKKFGRKAFALSMTIVLGASMILTGCGGSGKRWKRRRWHRPQRTKRIERQNFFRRYKSQR